MVKLRKRFIVPLSCVLIVVLGIKFYGAEIFTFLAFNEIKNKNFLTASKLAESALYLEPENLQARLVYVNSLSSIFPTYDVQKAMFDFSQSKKMDEADRIAEKRILEWRESILRRFGENYIFNAPYDTKLMHWDSRTFPLKVSFSSDAKVPDYYFIQARTAFDTWQRVSEGFFRFQFVDGNADIEVKILPFSLSNGQEKGHLGNPAFTVPSLQKDKLQKMSIYLYDRDRYGRYYPNDAVYTFVLHEISHALGVMGHSQNSNDIMYMSNIVSAVTGIQPKISKSDLNTLYLLYAMVPDITNTDKYNTYGKIYAPVVLGNEQEIVDRKIQEAFYYVQRAPFQVSGYIDLSVLYARVKQYDEAKAALEKALKVSKNDVDRYLINYNFAVLSMEMGRKNEALEYAKQAQSLDNNQDIQSLIAEIKSEL